MREMDLIHDAYRKLLTSVRDNPKPFAKLDKLVAHYPMRGLGGRVDVMFIGRALNGWTWQFDLPTSETDLDHLLERIKSNVAEPPKEGPDTRKVYSEREQLRWVDDRDADHPGYNSNRSQFWQTIREVMEEREPNKENWWHGIVWSNFLKLSRPKKNPTAGMVEVIGDPSMELLLAEIREYEPKHVVCLSGMDYAANLLARCEVSQRVANIENTRYIEYSGLVTLAGERNIGLLIVPHPQGKGKIRSRMVEEITTQLSKLEVLKKRYDKKRTLKTTLKREFFDAIYRGEKTEEYRDLSDFWMSRLLVKEPDGSYTFEKFRAYDTILFRNGYNPDSPTMEVEWKGTWMLDSPNLGPTT